jgi:hypothetical protein
VTALPFQLTSVQSRPRAHISFVIFISFVLLLSGCATQSYHYESTNSFPIRDRAISETKGNITISASVPGEGEAQAIFGIPIYDRGIQPVWLNIENNSEERVRFAPTGVDPAYFSPLEVAYMHRKGFSKEARRQMNQRFYRSAMPRQIPAGESRSGYVFTHASPGTKAFNVDIFSGGEDESFAFFVTVPGFVPDHQSVDFDTLYDRSQIHDYNFEGLRTGLENLPWFSTDQSGEQQGLPLGIVIVAQGIDVLKALLRAGWHESPQIRDKDQLLKANYLFGRVPDAVFRNQSGGARERNELNLWLAPMLIEGKEVWLAQIVHFIGQRTQLEQAVFGARIDPDVDEGRSYLLQNVWYAQSLEQVGWMAGSGSVSIESARFDFNSLEYFTDGYRIVIWLSGEPISLLESRRVVIDDPPFSR